MSREWLLRFTEKPAPCSAAELGCGSGERANTLLELLPALEYQGFDTGGPLLEACQTRLAHWRSRARLAKHDAAAPLPLADQSQDLFFSVDLFERLRMDELYMVCHEARRILRPGGVWVIHGLSVGDGALSRWLSVVAARLQRRRTLELTHYISPEDWNTLENHKERKGALIRQTLVLERLPG